MNFIELFWPQFQITNKQIVKGFRDIINNKILSKVKIQNICNKQNGFKINVFKFKITKILFSRVLLVGLLRWRRSSTEKKEAPDGLKTTCNT